MCFVFGLLIGFSVTLILEVLSALSSIGIEKPSYESLCIYQRACQAVVASTIYSDSVVKTETEFCFFEKMRGELREERTAKPKFG